jgi:arylsulfatase A-like enzyme
MLIQLLKSEDMSEKRRLMRFALKPFIGICFLLGAPTRSDAQQAGNKPNIVFIMADDLGYADIGSYGQDKIMTPNIDDLARTGMRFTQAYAGSSVCAPSRCSLMTGKHNGRNRVRDNVPAGVFLRPDDFTVAELLKQCGYATGGVGKWGLGNPGSWGLPGMQGFDYWYGHYDQDQAHYYYPDHLWENDKVVLLKQNKAGKRGAYTHDLFTQKAVEFIDKNASTPFFLYLAYTVPHFSDYPKKNPDVYTVPSDEPYTNRPWTQTAKNYAAMITRMDADVGRIKERLRQLGLSENTIIVFTSDNGPYTDVPEPMQFFKSNGKLRGGKRSFYEGGLRVPFIVNWKGKVVPGSVCTTPVAFWDIMPTIAEITGYPGAMDTDGSSFVGLLRGKRPEKEERVFYWDYGHTRDEYYQAVRKGKYKGIRTTTKDGQKTFELFDLSEDPEEKTNQVEAHSGVVAALEQEMDKAYHYSVDYDPKSDQR